MKKILLINLVVLMFSFNALAQDKEVKMVDVEGTEVTKSRGENPNIKNEFVYGAEDVKAEKPAASRGANCTVNIDNDSGYDVYVYVDGDYYGWVGAWREGAVTVRGGFTTVYCITTGGSYEWKTSGNCNSYFNYRIYL
jgi:hypothetical protein